MREIESEEEISNSDRVLATYADAVRESQNSIFSEEESENVVICEGGETRNQTAEEGETVVVVEGGEIQESQTGEEEVFTQVKKRKTKARPRSKSVVTETKRHRLDLPSGVVEGARASLRQSAGVKEKPPL